MSVLLLTVIGLAVLGDTHIGYCTVVQDVLRGSGAFCKFGTGRQLPTGRRN